MWIKNRMFVCNMSKENSGARNEFKKNDRMQEEIDGCRKQLKMGCFSFFFMLPKILSD